MSVLDTAVKHQMIMHTWASFSKEQGINIFTDKHFENMVDWTNEASDLLKTKEPKAVELPQKSGKDGEMTGYCPRCERPVKTPYNNFFCGNCGQAVVWG